MSKRVKEKDSVQKEKEMSREKNCGINKINDRNCTCSVGQLLCFHFRRSHSNTVHKTKSTRNRWHGLNCKWRNRPHIHGNGHNYFTFTFFIHFNRMLFKLIITMGFFIALWNTIYSLERFVFMCFNDETFHFDFTLSGWCSSEWEWFWC